MSSEVENLMSIGEFAAASQLSQKALRLYGDNGLLAPAWTDPDSGYRYYRAEQLRIATLIALLRRCGMPLAEIRSFLRDPSAARLDDYEQRMTKQLAERTRLLHHVKRLLEEEIMYDVVTKRVGDQTYVSRSKRVLIPELEPFISATFEELGASDENPGFVLYHGPVNEDEDGPVEVCVPRSDGEKRLPAGEVALTAISGEQCDFPAILGAYEAVYGWAKQHGREPAGPPREIYITCPPDPLRMEIALPLR